MPEPADNAPKQPPRTPVPQQARVLCSRDLFQGERQVLIEHDGVMYRLQVTRNGRLILQK